MHNSNNLKETITNLSHDIRTPLTSLDGYFQLLKESTSDKEKDKYSRIIQNRIVSLKIMLDELFTYTKLQDDNYTLVLEKSNFNKLLTATLFSFYDEFNTKGIEPQIDICDEQLSVFCNQADVIRVIQNIIKNSFEHSLSEMKITGLDLLRVRLFYSLKNGSSFLMKHKNKKKTISVWKKPWKTFFES